MTDSGAERAARRIAELQQKGIERDLELRVHIMAAIIREETATRDICGNCDHGVVGGKPCEYCKGSGYEERRKQSIEETGTQVERERDAAINILARLHWCECGHQHFGAEICMGCDCDEQVRVSREWLVEKIKAQAALPAAPDEGETR